MTKPLTPEQVAIIDRNHIWHPYSSLTKPIPAYQVVSASGVRLKLSDGTELIDGMSSWWSAIHGYNHPALNKACLLYTSPSPRDATLSRMPSSA